VSARELLPWLFLATSVWGAWFTYNALWPMHGGARRTVFSFFAIMGFLAGLAGALLASRLNTAVVLGGASLSGGVGSIFGAFLGVLFMSLLQNAMIVAGINPFWQLIVVGIVLVTSVGLDQFGRSRGRT